MKFLDTTPEFLNSSGFLKAALFSAKMAGTLQRIVFDEAHCVYEWGCEFRCVDYHF